MNNREIAEIAYDLDYTVIACRENSKVPCGPWSHLRKERPSKADMLRPFVDTRLNIALVCGGTVGGNGIIVVDMDTQDQNVLDVVMDRIGENKPYCETAGGGWHFLYRARKGVQVRNHTRIFDGLPVDIRGDGALAMLYYSKTEKGVYKPLNEGLRASEEFPVFKVSAIRKRTRKKARRIGLEPISDAFGRASAYVQKVPGAVSGSGGHDKTFWLACKLVRPEPYDPDDPRNPWGFGLSYDQAMQLMLWWNQRCDPPWQENEVDHKVTDAIKATCG